jgi:uncharacterized OB-fold protein
MQSQAFTAAAFYEFLAGRRLMGSRCACDGAVYLPPRALCPHCRRAEMQWQEFSGRGKLLTFTVIYIAPSAMLAAGFDRSNPYCVGIVELAEGPRISALLTGVDALRPASIALGSPVALDVQDLGPAGAQKAVLAFRVEAA